MTRVRSTQILVVLALANFISYAARNALITIYPQLTARYGSDDSELGLLQTVFMLPHAAATLGFGWAGDRFDRRRVIAAGMMLAAVAGALGALGDSYLWLAATRALVGLGTAAVVPVANSILGQLYDGPVKASRLSIFNLGLFGGAAGAIAGTVLGFPVVVVAIAIPGAAVAAIVTMLAVPPQDHARSAASGARHVSVYAMARTFAADARVLLRIPTLRWVLASATMMAFAAGGYAAWLKEFLVRDKGMLDGEATTLLVICGFGGLPGILTGGRLADRLARRGATGRMWTIILGMSATVPCASAAIVAAPGASLYVAGVATIFFMFWYHAPMAATVDDLAPPGLAVAAQGLVIFGMHMLGTAPSSWILGEISERSTLSTALWIPTGTVVVAALCMATATRTFARDRAASRAGGLRGG
ncbi:MAG TPA: MFS transporter [Kofleriaceae bacterium]|nr:MFS transporter [Kofleriaceae bacterium]